MKVCRDEEGGTEEMIVWKQEMKQNAQSEVFSLHEHCLDGNYGLQKGNLHMQRPCSCQQTTNNTSFSLLQLTFVGNQDIGKLNWENGTRNTGSQTIRQVSLWYLEDRTNYLNTPSQLELKQLVE